MGSRLPTSSFGRCLLQWLSSKVYWWRRIHANSVGPSLFRRKKLPRANRSVFSPKALGDLICLSCVGSSSLQVLQMEHASTTCGSSEICHNAGPIAIRVLIHFAHLGRGNLRRPSPVICLGKGILVVSDHCFLHGGLNPKPSSPRP